MPVHVCQFWYSGRRRRKQKKARSPRGGLNHHQNHTLAHPRVGWFFRRSEMGKGGGSLGPGYGECECEHRRAARRRRTRRRSPQGTASGARRAPPRVRVLHRELLLSRAVGPQPREERWAASCGVSRLRGVVTTHSARRERPPQRLEPRGGRVPLARSASRSARREFSRSRRTLELGFARRAAKRERTRACAAASSAQAPPLWPPRAGRAARPRVCRGRQIGPL